MNLKPGWYVASDSESGRPFGLAHVHVINDRVVYECAYLGPISIGIPTGFFDSVNILTPVDLEKPKDYRKDWSKIIPLPNERTRFYFFKLADYRTGIGTSDMFPYSEKDKPSPSKIIVFIGTGRSYDIDTQSIDCLNEISRDEFEEWMDAKGFEYDDSKK